jgi:hypothetical protein
MEYEVMPPLEGPPLKDKNGNPLVIGNSYRIELRKPDPSIRPSELVNIFGHNEIGTLKRLFTVEGDTPSGVFELKNGHKVLVNNFICTFTPCSGETCISGGKRRSRRTKRSRRRRSRRFA